MNFDALPFLLYNGDKELSDEIEKNKGVGTDHSIADWSRLCMSPFVI